MKNKIIEKQGYGYFGNLSKQYAKYRTGYPKEVVEYFWSKIQIKNPRILDIGCGTGISTRQLIRSGAKILGADKDVAMIEEAKKISGDIEYLVADADKLPFGDESFDGATSFGAFHWFADDSSAREIKRVLKPDGIYFIVNKRELGGIKTEFRNIIKNVVDTLPDIKIRYNAQDTLERNQFSKVEYNEFDANENFTIDHAIQYVQTISLWNLVPDNKRKEVLSKFELYCKNSANDGIVKSITKIKVTTGIK